MGSRPTHVFANGRSHTNLHSVGSDSKKFACNAEDLGLFPGLERSPEEGMTTHSSILAYRIPMDSGAWQTTVHGVSKEPDTTEPLSTRHVPFNGTQGFPDLHILNSTSRLSF